MSRIEASAKDCGYFQEYLASYPPLWEAAEHKRAESHDCQAAFNYWSAFGKLQYMAFETLYYLRMQLQCAARNGSLDGSRLNCGNHLPTFMATYMGGYAVSEYLINMIVFHEVSPGHLQREQFFRLTGPQFTRGKRKDALLSFCGRISAWGGEASPVSEMLESDGHSSGPYREIRNRLSHRFRFAWAPGGSHGFYGFPAQVRSGARGMDDVMWRSVESRDWESEIRSLGDEGFVSGVCLVEQLHSALAKVADTVFQTILREIWNGQAPPAKPCT